MLILCIILVLFVSACSKCPESCDDEKVCTRDVCSKDTKYECRHIPVPNCVCGNGDCDEAAGENQCTCAEDCGACAGQVSDSVVYKCVNDVCDVSVKPELLQLKTTTDAFTLSAGKLIAVSEMNLPFNFVKDVVNLKLHMENFATGVDKIKITKVEFTGYSSRQKTTLAEREVNKMLWTTDTVIEEVIPLVYKGTEQEGEFAGLYIKVYYEYDKESTSGIVQKSESKELKYPFGKFKFVNTGVKECGVCDDGNAGTKDSCGEETNYFCEYTLVANTCGNFDCGSGEDKCNCPNDCGPCSGDVGKYLEMGCISKKCETFVKDLSELKSTTVLDERTISGFKIQTKITYDEPFNLMSSELGFVYTLETVGDGLTDLAITKIQLLEGTKLLGEKAVNLLIMQSGSEYSSVVPFDFDMKENEGDKKIKIKVSYSYKKDEEVKKATYEKTLESIHFLNPTK